MIIPTNEALDTLVGLNYDLEKLNMKPETVPGTQMMYKLKRMMDWLDAKQ
jgi:hypothetical protein